jgi:hypothetical protein
MKNDEELKLDNGAEIPAEISQPEITTPGEIPNQESSVSEFIEPQITSKQNLSGGDYFGREEYAEIFIEAVNTTSKLAKLKSLAIDTKNDSEMICAIATANTVHRAASKFSALRFLIDKREGWIIEAIVAGGFVGGKAGDVAKEVKGKMKWQMFKAKVKGLATLGRRGAVKPQPQEKPLEA